MAYEITGDQIGVHSAGADLSSSQFFAVKLNSSGQVILGSVAGEQDIIGVLKNNPVSGAVAEVQTSGVTKAVAGAAITAGSKVTTSAAGKVVALVPALTAGPTIDVPSIAANTVFDTTITVTGALAGDFVEIAPPAALNTGLILATPFVSASNTVTMRILNPTGGAIDPASGTFNVLVTRQHQKVLGTAMEASGGDGNIIAVNLNG